jgi:hypothetical protein
MQKSAKNAFQLARSRFWMKLEKHSMAKLCGRGKGRVKEHVPGARSGAQPSDFA